MIRTETRRPAASRFGWMQSKLTRRSDVKRIRALLPRFVTDWIVIGLYAEVVWYAPRVANDIDAIVQSHFIEGNPAREANYYAAAVATSGAVEGRP
jgi:hypothetical protein